MSLLNRLLSRSTPATAKPHAPFRSRLGVQQLEARDVPAGLDFLSGFGAGSADDRSGASDVAADAAGNSYLTGYFYGTLDLDPAAAHAGDTDILTSAGGSDIFVAKYAPDNSLVWARRMGGTAPDVGSGVTDIGRAIKVDGGGNVYVTGQFRGTADYGAASLSAAGGGKDGFVTKLDAAGSFLWSNHWGLADNIPMSGYGEYGQGVGIDAGGSVYVLGSRIAVGGSSYHGYDILKYGSGGTAVWSKSLYTTATPTSGDLVADAAGNVFVTGQFYGTADFDPNGGTRSVYAGPGVSSGFVLKLTSAGNFGWVAAFTAQSQTVGGVTTNGSSASSSIVLDGGGNVIVGGYYRNKVDFNPGSGTANLPTRGGLFITKLTGTGGFVWAKALEDISAQPSYSYVYGLAVDTAGSVYATGSLSGTLDFDPGSGTRALTTAGSYDAFVVKLTSTGSLAWAESFGGPGDDVGMGIAVDPAGTIHFAGHYSGTVDFDPDPTDTFNLTNPGTYRNIFLVKFRQS